MIKLNPITTKVSTGDFYETTVEVCGKDYPLVIYYIHHPAIPGNETDLPEKEYLEFTSVLLEVMEDWVELKSTSDWDLMMEDEILESLQ